MVESIRGTCQWYYRLHREDLDHKYVIGLQEMLIYEAVLPNEAHKMRVEGVGSQQRSQQLPVYLQGLLSSYTRCHITWLGCIIVCTTCMTEPVAKKGHFA